MIKFWKRIAGGDPKDDAAEIDEKGQLGAAALLVAIARSDEVYEEVEKAQILSMIQSLFQRDAASAKALLAEAEEAQIEAMDVQRFTLAVKAAYTPEERAVFLEAAWRVILADDERAHKENMLMRRLTGLLGVEDRVSAQARHRAEAQIRAQADES